jgi:hydroxymethylbilane synthase
MVVTGIALCCPDMEVEVSEIRTVGDRVTDRPLATLGGYGAFTKELDQRIVDGEIDAAVNSLKDMPVDLTPGTALAAVLPRGPVEDILLSAQPLEKLPSGAVIGSSSVRRSSMIRAKRPDLVIRDLRGNVPTRIRKWREGEYDAIVLARAGLRRLELSEEGFILDPEVFTPAPGQGAIAVVCAANSKFLNCLRKLNDKKTRIEVEAERSILRGLGGGCSVPIGAWATLEEKKLRMRASVISDVRGRSLTVDRTLALEELDKGLAEMVEKLRPALGGNPDAR